MTVPTIQLYKDGEFLVCNLDRREHFEALGWAEKQEAKKEELKQTQTGSIKKKGK